MPNRNCLNNDNEFTNFFTLLGSPNETHANPVQLAPPPGTAYQAPPDVLEEFYEQVEQAGPRPDRPLKQRADLLSELALQHRTSSADPFSDADHEIADRSSMAMLDRWRTTMAAAQAATAAALQQPETIRTEAYIAPTPPVTLEFVYPEASPQLTPTEASKISTVNKAKSNTTPKMGTLTPGKSSTYQQRVPGSTDLGIFAPPEKGISVNVRLRQELGDAKTELTPDKLAELKRVELLQEAGEGVADSGNPDLLERILAGLHRL